MIRDDMRFDTRTLKHRLRRGEYTPTDLETHLSKLPDESEESEETTVRFAGAFEERHYGATEEEKTD